MKVPEKIRIFCDYFYLFFINSCHVWSVSFLCLGLSHFSDVFLTLNAWGSPATGGYQHRPWGSNLVSWLCTTSNLYHSLMESPFLDQHQSTTIRFVDMNMIYSRIKASGCNLLPNHCHYCSKTCKNYVYVVLCIGLYRYESWFLGVRELGFTHFYW